MSTCEMTRYLKSCPRSLFENLLYEAKLTPRQEEILRYRFLKNKKCYQIAMDMYLSEETVKDDIKKSYKNIQNVLNMRAE